MEPLNLKAGETLVTLKLKAREEFVGSQSIDLQLTPESELADEMGDVLQLAELSTLSIRSMNLDSEELDPLIKSCHIYPNPANEVVYIELETQNALTITLQLSDMLGNELYFSEEACSGQKKDSMEIATNHLRSGIYVLQITILSNSDTQEIQRKIFIQNN
jgi:hypothetical protein